jgi:BNR/Asp-box repeat
VPACFVVSLVLAGCAASPAETPAGSHSLSLSAPASASGGSAPAVSATPSASPLPDVVRDGPGWAATSHGFFVSEEPGGPLRLVPAPVQVADAWVTDERVVVAGPPNGYFPVVSESTDSGKTWHTTHLPKARDELGGLRIVASSGHLLGVQAVVMSSSAFSEADYYRYVGGSWTETTLPADGIISVTPTGMWLAGGVAMNQLYVSTDAGRSWSKRVLPVARDEALTPPQPLGSGELVMTASAPADRTTISVLLSRDGGRTWSRVTSFGSGVGFGAGVTPAVAVLGDVLWIGVGPWSARVRAAADPVTANVAVGDSVAGLTWSDTYVDWLEPLGPHSAVAGLYASPGCPNGKASCAEPANRIVRTDDGGKTWTDVSF